MSAWRRPPYSEFTTDQILPPPSRPARCASRADLLTGWGRLGDQAGLVVAQDLARRPRAFCRTTLHEALEVLRAVLAREVALPAQRVRLPGLLVAAEQRVLADLPVRVRPSKKRIVERHVERRAAVPPAGD